jgi:hypothetical protein
VSVRDGKVSAIVVDDVGIYEWRETPFFLKKLVLRGNGSGFRLNTDDF